MLIEKATTILLTVELMRKTQNKSVKTEIVRSKCENWIRFVKLCKKADLKNATGVDTSDSARKMIKLT